MLYQQQQTELDMKEKTVIIIKNLKLLIFKLEIVYNIIMEWHFQHMM